MTITNKKQTNPNTQTDKLSQELKEAFKEHQKDPSVIEQLQLAAALRLWKERGFREVVMNVSLHHDGQRFSVKVLAKNKQGKLFGVECATTVRLGRFRDRVARLRACLPPDSYIIAVFPQGAGKKTGQVAGFVDEVWVMGEG